jgi:hypothetical protein
MPPELQLPKLAVVLGGRTIKAFLGEVQLSLDVEIWEERVILVRSDQYVGDRGVCVDPRESRSWNSPVPLLRLNGRRPDDKARGDACKDALKEATSLSLMCSSNSQMRRRSLVTSSKTS